MSVLVYTENWDGKFKKLTFELVSYAAAVAKMLNTTVTAVSIGRVSEEELKRTGDYGAAKMINVSNGQLSTLDNQAYTAILSDVAARENSKVVIVSNNNTGKAIAPRLAVRLNAGLASGVAGLPTATDPFTVNKRAYSGNAVARIIIDTEIKIITLAQNSFEIEETGNQIVIENYNATEAAGQVKTSVIEVKKQTGKMLLTDAEIVVSGGRGMKSAENWAPLVELADLLGGATACSRPVSDEGWRPHDEHTGQTGKIIAPNLYLALGISGATQHLAGISSSKYIVAVNQDKDAPIFEAAQYGIVGDVMKVLPKLIEAVKEIKK